MIKFMITMFNNWFHKNADIQWCCHWLMMYCLHDIWLLATRNWNQLQFYFPEMDKIVTEYCYSCDVCQRRAPVKVKDGIPIHPIECGDELSFNHLIMYRTGPIVPT
jgi:Pyruvate/2-oxoacid:ferredoxin oxidoreductase delta subunit